MQHNERFLQFEFLLFCARGVLHIFLLRMRDDDGGDEGMNER